MSSSILIGCDASSLSQEELDVVQEIDNRIFHKSYGHDMLTEPERFAVAKRVKNHSHTKSGTEQLIQERQDILKWLTSLAKECEELNEKYYRGEAVPVEICDEHLNPLPKMKNYMKMVLTQGEAMGLK